MRGVKGSFSFYIRREKGVLKVEFVEIAKDLISNIGFPIACACMMFWEMEQERKAHKEESSKWVEALNRNTSVMEKILVELEEK